MRARGAGIGVPILGLTVPLSSQIVEGVMEIVKSTALNPSPALNGTASALPPAPVAMQRAKPLNVRHEGNNIYASTGRTNYHAVVGAAYTPLSLVKDSSPKVLVAVGLVGEEWQVSIGPVGDTRGRTRGMQLGSFLARYVKGTALVSKRERGPLRENGDRSRSRLERIECKLDLLLEQLGVKYVEAT